MKISIVLILLLPYVKIFSQKKIELKILNDTIYFYHSKDEYFEKVIECELIFELKNNSSNNYYFYWDTSRVIPHYFFKHNIYNKKLRYDHQPYIQTLLYDSKFKRLNKSGGFINLDLELDSLKNLLVRDSLIIADYSSREIKLKPDQILENYSYNKNKYYLLPYETKKIQVRMTMPNIDNYNYIIHTYDLNVNMNYYLEFFLYNDAKKIKNILTKSEMELLKYKNIKIFNGSIHTMNKVPLSFKNVKGS